MAKSQFPLDGKQGKHWKVTSKFGYRVHPIKKTKKHHNGVDIWKAGNPYLEACFDGKVVGVSTSTDPNGAGNKVVVQSTVMGKKVTWTYFHLVKGSIKVKVGQRITAGTVVGRMGQTGFATGDHLHWEIWAGHLKSQPMAGFHNGKGFYDPMKFTASVIAFEAANAEAVVETPVDAPVSVMPAHSAAPVVASKPATTPFKDVKVGSKGANVKAVQKVVGVTADGVFGPMTEKAVKVWQKKVGLPITGIIDSVAWLKIVGK
jgi:murein DD-endopeptidase MepM/ murein hydrolase activator NlpD